MARDKAYLVILQAGRGTKGFLQDSLEEMRELTLSAGGEVVGASLATIPHPSPSHFIREGKLEEVNLGAKAARANVIIFNVSLSPGQARNIEEACETKVVDRTGLILDIFARRAVSHEGKMQVELAQLNYLMPRLVGKGVIMSRLGGGIGTRGPGEQKLEVDRRKIRERIQRVKQDLVKLEKHRELLRAGRREKGLAQVSLVGYTNAGKTTLLNALTNAGAYTADQLFATLDSKTRIQKLGGPRDVLFTDTVGFLKDLPHSLIEAFHATLEEVSEADILIHVLDASSLHGAVQKQAVEGVLKEIGAGEKPVILALNKADLLQEEDQRRIQEAFPQGVLISAKQKLGLQALLTKLTGDLQIQSGANRDSTKKP